MQDFVPLGTGNSRNLKSSISTGTTWEQALEMLRNGTFPIDIGAVNDSGVAQKGTPLHKATLLSAETEALYPGLPENPVPDDVFAYLGTKRTWKLIKTIDLASKKTVVLDLGSFCSKVKTYKFNSPGIEVRNTIQLSLNFSSTSDFKAIQIDGQTTSVQRINNYVYSSKWNDVFYRFNFSELCSLYTFTGGTLIIGSLKATGSIFPNLVIYNSYYLSQTLNIYEEVE